MKAMLEPRIVAASIQVLVSGLPGTPIPTDRITASSQGTLMNPMDASTFELGSGSNLLSCVITQPTRIVVSDANSSVVWDSDPSEFSATLSKNSRTTTFAFPFCPSQHRRLGRLGGDNFIQRFQSNAFSY